MAIDLSGFLRDLRGDLDKAFVTADAVTNHLEAEQQSFLKGFCSVVEREILPTFEEAEAFSSENLVMKVIHDELESIELRVTVKKPLIDKPLSGMLRYRVDLTTKEIIREMQKRGEDEVTAKKITSDLLLSEEVKSCIAILTDGFRNGRKKIS